MIPFVQVDSFTSAAFAGNPAAVCFLPGERDASWMQPWMQNVAREMNLAETAFLRPLDGEGGRREFELRWFTPAVEVDLCGHATLASAHALWESGRLAPTEEARFHTRSGVLTAVRLADGWIQMDFPVTATEPAAGSNGLVDALGVTALYVGRSRFDYLVQVESEKILRDLSPDLRRLCAIEARGVIVTSRAEDPDYDFVSRFFAPRAGIDEDPVTGSAHCTLADFWSKQLGKSQFLARQISARGGVLRVELRGDRVLLGGQAITVLRGELLA